MRTSCARVAILAWSPAGIQPSRNARSVETITGPAAQSPTTGASQRSLLRSLQWAGRALTPADRTAAYQARYRPHRPRERWSSTAPDAALTGDLPAFVRTQQAAMRRLPVRTADDPGRRPLGRVRAGVGSRGVPSVESDGCPVQQRPRDRSSGLRAWATGRGPGGPRRPRHCWGRHPGLRRPRRGSSLGLHPRTTLSRPYPAGAPHRERSCLLRSSAPLRQSAARLHSKGLSRSTGSSAHRLPANRRLSGPASP